MGTIGLFFVALVVGAVVAVIVIWINEEVER